MLPPTRAHHPWDEEAIPERDPRYELPADPDTDTPPTMSREDEATWRMLVNLRPLLALIRR